MKDRVRTLNVMLVLYVFWILVLSGAITASSFYLMLTFGFRPFFLTQLMTPVYTLVICVFIGTTVSAGLGRKVLRPINELIHATKRVARGDFSAQVNKSNAPGELEELVDSFNEMTRELSGNELFKKDFINSFSHEFKTPIVSIRGFARQLQRTDLTEEQRKEYTDIIIAESERLSNMSSNILLLTRLENQQIVTGQTSYRLDEQIRSCLLLLEKQWTSKALSPELDLDEVTYCGNEEMVSQVWINLISNAIKFSKPGGEIRLRERAFADMILIDVEDDGVGMDEATQKRIFDRFYQGDTAHATEGNGLGLSLVRRIVDLCGGAVSVRSTPGAGACFTVKLPYRLPQTVARPVPKPDALPKSTEG